MSELYTIGEPLEFKTAREASTVTVKGNRITSPHFPTGFTYGIYEGPQWWHVVELSSGFGIGRGGNPDVAVEVTISKLATLKPGDFNKLAGSKTILNPEFAPYEPKQ